MHDEAREVLPRLLDAIGFRRGLLLGHSDGASIAAIYAGSVQDHRVRGLVLIAPHFFTEDMGIAEIARAKEAYATTDLRAKLARWHADVDNAFRGWNDAWLDPGFRKWDITDELAYIRVPVLIVQGADDQYGTVKQIEAAERECYCPVEVALLPGVRHSPHREAPECCSDDRVRRPALRQPRRLRSRDMRSQRRAWTTANRLFAPRRSARVRHCENARMADTERSSPMAGRGSTSRPIRRAIGTGSSRSTATSPR